MILLAYARYSNMALLVIDPQGEFSRDMRLGTKNPEFALPVKQVAQQLGKQTVVLTVRNLVLDRWELFEQILFESQFFDRLTIPRGGNRELAGGFLANRLQKPKVRSTDLLQRTRFNAPWGLLAEERVQRV